MHTWYYGLGQTLTSMKNRYYGCPLYFRFATQTCHIASYTVVYSHRLVLPSALIREASFSGERQLTTIHTAGQGAKIK